MQPPPTPPKLRPRGTTSILLVAWVAYRSIRNGRNGGKAEQQASYGFLQELFRFKSENTVEAALKRVRAPASTPWVTIGTRATRATGHHYKLDKGALADADQWYELGAYLYGPAGILTPFLYQSVLYRSPEGFHHSGTLVLAVVAKHGPVAPDDLMRYLSHFMDRKTAATKLRNLVAHELVECEDGKYFTQANLRERVVADSLRHGGAARARHDDLEIGWRQYEHQVAVLGGPTLVRVRSMLRKAPCFYCSDVPPPSGGTVEHFPPKHWGGSDEFSLLLPACVSCNSSHGAILKGTEPSEAPLPLDVNAAEIAGTRVNLPGNEADAKAFFFSVMLLNAALYADHLNEGRIDEARAAALDMFPLWMALKLRVLFPAAISRSDDAGRPDHDMAQFYEASEPLTGLPGLLGGTRGKRQYR